MGNVRGTLFFVDHTSWRATGWSETHYFASNSLSLPEAIVRLDAYAPLRQALLAPGIAVTYARVSDDTVFRDSQITAGYRPLLPVALTATNLFPIDAPPPSSGAPGPNILPGNPLFANDPSDMAWTAVLMRGEAGAPFIGRSMFWIAGLPDNLTFSFNRGITDATWKGAFDTWANFLTQNFAFLGQDNSNANPPKNITMVAKGIGDIVITSAGHGLVNGDMVAIRGVKTISNAGRYVNHKWQVFIIDANSFTLIGSAPGAAFTYLSGGQARKQVKALQNFAKVLQRRFGSRKKGRPFDLAIGKVRAKKTA